MTAGRGSCFVSAHPVPWFMLVSGKVLAVLLCWPNIFFFFVLVSCTYIFLYLLIMLTLLFVVNAHLHDR